MATILQRLARWARDLEFNQLPPSVVLRARLQHLSTAGAVRAVRGRAVATALSRTSRGGGSTSRVTGGAASVREAVRLHAGLAGWLSYDDTLFLGHPTGAAAVAAWAAAEGRSLGDLLTATVVANEISGRLGASLALGPGGSHASAPVQAAAVAAALGWLQGLDADDLAHALAIALAAPPLVPLSTLLGGGMARALATSAPAVVGVDAIAQARAGVKGALDLLDARDGLLGAHAWVPLRNAFTGLGSAWLTDTIAFSLHPASVWHQTSIQGVAEILRRHVKASDKRLRLDQLERIEIRSSVLSWGLEQAAAEHPGLDPAAIPTSARRAIGALLVAYEYGPAQLDPAWLAANQDEVAEAARRVEVSHDWRHTLRFVDHVVDVAAPLLAGVTLSELISAGQQARRAFGLTLPPPGGAELLAVLQARPDRVLDRLKHASGDLASARLREWQFVFPAEVKLFTVRGGSWPEERVIPEGSPGWAWNQTVAGVLAKYAAGAADADERGRKLLEAAEAQPAGEWVGALLS